MFYSIINREYNAKADALPKAVFIRHYNILNYVYEEEIIEKLSRYMFVNIPSRTNHLCWVHATLVIIINLNLVKTLDIVGATIQVQDEPNLDIVVYMLPSCLFILITLPSRCTELQVRSRIDEKRIQPKKINM